MNRNSIGPELFTRVARVLGLLLTGIAILAAATVAGCTVGGSITSYLASPYAVRWQRLDSSEKFVKILAADAEFVYVQSATGKVYYRSLTDGLGQWEATSAAAVRTRGGGPLAIDSVTPKPPGQVVDMAHGEMRGPETTWETRYAVTGDGAVWSWRYAPAGSLYTAMTQTVMNASIGLLIGVFLLLSFVPDLRKPRTGLEPDRGASAWRIVALWVLLVPFGQILAHTVLESAQLGFSSLWPNRPIDYGRLFVGEALAGAALGLSQWWVLYIWRYSFRGWVLLTALGWGLGALVGTMTDGYFGWLFGPGWASHVFLPGLGAALAQSFYLRRPLLRALLWVALNAAALAFGIISIQEYRAWTYPNFYTYITCAISGPAMVLLFRHLPRIGVKE